MKLRGLDHADIRVPSLQRVEAFYDAVLPRLGLTRKTESHVGADGEWYDVDGTHVRNVIEYHAPSEPGKLGWFVGFIEDTAMAVTKTRIAFALENETDLQAAEALIREAGGQTIEWSIDESYPALFFEDPTGTRLELCARRPRPTPPT